LLIGMVEDIIHGRCPGLRALFVIARNTRASPTKGRAVDVKADRGRELGGFATVLEGSVRKAANRGALSTGQPRSILPPAFIFGARTGLMAVLDDIFFGFARPSG